MTTFTQATAAKRILAGLLLVLISQLPWTVGLAQGPADARGFNAAIDPAIDALWSGYDAKAAMEHVQFINQYWRLAGNPGYNATVDRIRERLTAAGLKIAVDEYPLGGPAWDHSAAAVAIVRKGAPDEVVLSREKERLTLCINSFSTPAGGVTAPLVDVGRGAGDADYANKVLKGAVVLGDADVGTLWRRAVMAQGAIGVISTSLPGYLNADPPGAKPTPRDQWDILQWGSVPYDEARKAFGFKASPRAAATLRKRIAEAGADGLTVKVTITSSFSTGPARTLVAEIPGAVAPAERIVMAAHIQEPGANDNASGVATLAELAAAMSTAIKQKKIAAPGRTLTFLFLNEISGSRRWLQDHPADAKLVKYMFSLDMTGEDVTKTGGTFLVERYPDPGAVWDRPWDPHTEWGRGNVRADSLKGDLINDAHFAVIQRVAAKSKWVVTTNPYEGGSDHTVFGTAGVPSVLDWHFTDRYYHTNFDTPDKTSPPEMRNVAVAVGATAWLFASADEAKALDIANIVAAAGRARIAKEEKDGAQLPNSTALLAAWHKWNAEAIRSASRLLMAPPSASFTQKLDALAAQMQAASTTALFGRALPAGVPAFRIARATAQAPQAAVTIEQGPAKFVCGSDASISPILMHWTNVVLAADGRLFTPCPQDQTHGPEHREVREGALLNAARNSTDPDIRWRAVQAYSRMGRGLGGVFATATVTPVCNAEVQIFGGLAEPKRWQAGELFSLVRNRPENVQVSQLNVTGAPSRGRPVPATVTFLNDPRVRREAAFGIGVAVSRPNLDANVATAARKEIQACLLLEKDSSVIALLLEDIGITRYGSDADRAAAAQFLVERSKGTVLEEVLGAAKGLEALIRQAPGWEVGDAARIRLRELVLREPPNVSPGQVPVIQRIQRLAMGALQAARDEDEFTLDRAADNRDWQVRRLVAMMLNLSDAGQARIGERVAQDREFQVRYDYLGSLARLVTRTRLCAPLTPYLKDMVPTVAMRAMDLMSARCTDLEEPLKIITAEARRIEKPESFEQWHLPSRALSALARLNSSEAKPLLKVAGQHQVWQVRAAAAQSFVTLGLVDEALALAHDTVPNVQTAAIEALTRAKEGRVLEPALEVLRYGSDFQVLRAAANAMVNVPEEKLNDATQALLTAMRRLTALDQDTSRDPRLSIIAALGRVMRKEQAFDLAPFMNDLDDEVNAAAYKTFTTLTAFEPPPANPFRRYPFQPTAQTISSLPHEATIQLADGGGDIVIGLLGSEAPVTIARFAALANAGYYNGLTFHRIVPNFVVQGGSPGANEYVGTSRFMRDEVSPAPHLRGAVGISTRGKDTGDAQIFIDLVDLPRLDRDYTVFGYVTGGMEFVDRMLEGAVIKGIKLR